MPRVCYFSAFHLSGVCSKLWSFGGVPATCKSESTPYRKHCPSSNVVMYFLRLGDRNDKTGCIAMHVSFVYTGWLLCIGLLAIAISHRSSTLKRGGLICFTKFRGAIESNYKTLLFPGRTLRAFLQFRAHLYMMSLHHVMQSLHFVGNTVL